jgi:hypothetical protein
MAFDTRQKTGDCLSLVTESTNLPGAPVLLAHSQPASVCDLLAESGLDAGAVAGQNGTLSQVPYGPISVLAVAQHAGADFFLGCTEITLAAGTEPVSIEMTPVSSTVAVPPTTCTTVADKCAGNCS